uniref:NADH dehydrogenase subunit 2 n=1 Tax=Malassezia cuniculi TaxID=948313 RepID=UPI003002B930|nr:NADH dehydrogenase subunit 2 [Malassezia cuniculi]
MLSIGLISYIIAIPLFSDRISPTIFSRITSIFIVFSALLCWNVIYYYPISDSTIGIYSGLFNVNILTLSFEVVLLVICSMILFGWGPVTNKIYNNYKIEDNNKVNTNFVKINTIGEYSLLVIFGVLGSCVLISSNNLLSMYMGIELQSFAAYILCSLYRNSQSATSAGLKYFLLGSLASGIILLGTGIIYSATGMTSFDDLSSIVSTMNITNVIENNDFVTVSVASGLIFIGIGYIFKVGAAPLYNWSPDVYDGVPTIITSWIATMPKIGLLVSLCTIVNVFSGGDLSNMVNGVITTNFTNLLLVSSVLSFVIGSIVGLSQVRIKRLLTFSTINHVGFLLLALAVITEESMEGFVFYLIQYAITNVNTFLTVLAFGYATKGIMNTSGRVREFQLLDDLKGQFKSNPLLAISFGVSLFSMAGIPPMIGFFAKQMVLYSVSYNYSVIAVVAILMSVIGASYYLKIVKLMFFDNNTSSSSSSTSNITSESESVSVNKNTDNEEFTITTVHSSIISILTLTITLYLFDSSILLNACHLISLSIFNN